MANYKSVIACLFAIGCAQGAYYGKLIQSGWGTNPAHQLSGDIYSVDKDRIQIKGFSFDGNAPGGVFLLGTSRTYSEVQGAGASSDPSAVVIANPRGNFEELKRYDNEDVVLKLPTGRVLADYTYISVWCRNVSVYFGGADIPKDFLVPKPQMIGRLATRDHGVSSGDITILDDKTIRITGLHYDGQGPDAFFYVGATSKITKQRAPHGKIPDENGSRGVISSYSGKDVTLTLPGSLSFTKLKWLSLYCIRFSKNFGEILIPADLNVPPSLAVEMNCEPLSDDLQVSWLVNKDTITVELAGNINRNTDYMAFGLSGSDTSLSMINADVVVTDWKENQLPRAVDYFITGYAQCAGNGGACPDTSTSNKGVDDVKAPSGVITNGVVKIKYQRALFTGESVNDKPYKIDGTKQQIVWAIGPLNTKNEAAKHYPTGGRINVKKTINFGRPVANNCPSLVKKVKVVKPNFKPHHLYGRKGSTVFTAEIGQAGSEQGYRALTGKPSWGIAWYINGILIPELHLKRGVSYTFRVGGGTNPATGAKYHPFYFTDDIEGGYQQKKNAKDTIYPGTVNGQRMNYTVGGYCEWKLTRKAVKANGNGNVYQCFEEMKQDLVLDCDEGTDGYTEFTWTPDSTTPDTLYYQCYTHKSLGWKVHIYDELPTAKKPAEHCMSSAAGVSGTNNRLVYLLLAILTVSLT